MRKKNSKISRENFKILLSKFFIVALFLIILCATFQLAYGKNAKELSFILREFKTGNEIKNGRVEVSATSSEMHKDFKFNLKNESRITMNLDDGTWDFVIAIDDDRTPSYDYFVKHHIESNWSDKFQTIYLFPVGAVNVRVEDINGNLISNAHVKIECLENRFLKVDTKTDVFGMASNEIVPVGNCSALASFNDAAGITSFNTIKGRIKNVIITLDKRVVSENLFIKKYLFLLIIGGGLVLIILLLRKKIVHQNKKEREKKDEKSGVELYHSIEIDDNAESEFIKETETQPKVIPAKLEQVMKTLPQKEKAVIEYLMSHNFSAKRSKVRYDLMIPKTTFSRIIKNLEAKKIIIVERDSKPSKLKINFEFL